MSSFSKLFERTFFDKLLNFIVSNNLLSDLQHGFLLGRSVETVVFEHVFSVLRDLEKGKLALGLFLDLSKAFYCLSHPDLLAKLERYEVRGPALSWVGSYL